MHDEHINLDFSAVYECVRTALLSIDISPSPLARVSSHLGDMLAKLIMAASLKVGF